MSVFEQVRRYAAVEVVPSRGARRALAVLAFAAATALGAYVSVPLPGTVVPVTLQTLFVVLSGLVLGPWLGAASQLTYLSIGLSGVPVFQGAVGGLGVLLRPSAGYLVAFPLASFAAGIVAGGARRGWLAELRLLAGAAFGSALVLLFGAWWLGLLLGQARGFETGLLPFVPGDAVKVLVAFLAARRVRGHTLSLL